MIYSSLIMTEDFKQIKKTQLNATVHKITIQTYKTTPMKYLIIKK
jgi:hypothetical protein